PRADGEWRSRIAEEWHRGALRAESARSLLGDDIVERAKLESKGIHRARIQSGVLPLDGVWHPSELNSLSSCPFVFLSRHLLMLVCVPCAAWTEASRIGDSGLRSAGVGNRHPRPYHPARFLLAARADFRR